MKTRALKISIFMLWGGSALLLLGLLMSLPTFLATFAPTSQIATAPPLDTGALATESARMALNPEATSQPEPSVPLPTPEETKPAVAPTPTPVPVGTPPRHIQIPSLRVDAPIVPVQWESTEVAGGTQPVWQVPDWKAVGWHEGSALLGLLGNTVLNGHNTTRGEIFRDLYKLEEGDLILVEGEDQRTYAYEVQHLYILEEAGQPLEVRLANARYVQPTTDERLTLVTCHPYGSMRYRLIVIGRPIPQPEDDGSSSKIEQ